MKRETRNIIIAVVLTFIFTVTAGVGFIYYQFGPVLKDNLLIMEIMQHVENSSLQVKTRDELVRGAIDGMISTLHDPFTYYLDPNQFKMMQAKTQGFFGGVGLEIGIEEGKGLTVIAPISGTPAEKAGIKAKDRIVKIDGKSTAKMTLDQAANLLRGPENTSVTVSVRRDGKPSVMEFRLTRARIPLYTVQTQMLKDGIGYMRLSMFSDTSPQEVQEGIAKLKKEGMKALILDLRNNPGGVLDAAVKIGQQLVPAGPIVSIHYRMGEPQVYYSKLKKAPFPMVVLINEGSASASEILSGALQDTKAATLVGTKSFGKGVVQSIYTLSNGGGLGLTVAEYLTPKGRHIQHRGIIPDEVVQLPDNARSDVQLERGIEILQQKMKK